MTLLGLQLGDLRFITPNLTPEAEADDQRWQAPQPGRPANWFQIQDWKTAAQGPGRSSFYT